ncbi:hypothetical protein Tco_1130023 [Tanacetum coccineum]
MEISKRETIPMQEKLKLSKSQGASTPAEKQCMLKLSKSQGTSTPVRCTRPDAVFAQNITSRFQQNPDAEYIATFDASKDAVWIQKFIGVVPTIEEPINMYCDNTGAIAIAKDHGVTKGARHFHAKVHYLRETTKIGDVRIEKVNTDDNLADPFMKVLAFPKHFELTRNIGMIPASELHWTTVKNILKYLRNTKDMFLVYGGAVDWKSTKQSIFATSSTDDEYIAAFDASKEVVWIRKFISGLGVVPTIEEPINMYYDNTGAIAIAKDPGITKGARHFHSKVHSL